MTRTRTSRGWRRPGSSSPSSSSRRQQNKLEDGPRLTFIQIETVFKAVSSWRNPATRYFLATIHILGWTFIMSKIIRSTFFIKNVISRGRAPFDLPSCSLRSRNLVLDIIWYLFADPKCLEPSLRSPSPCCADTTSRKSNSKSFNVIVRVSNFFAKFHNR